MFPHLPIFCAVILGCIPASGRGFSRPSTATNAVAGSANAPELSDLAQQAEVATIIEKAAQLEAYHDARRPDCFRRVAGALRVHCGELEVDEGERIRAAIAMTLCELATANHSPPLECAPHAAEGPSPEYPSRASLNTCVEALSRSAQYWSSYSGYLREAPQLCYAYRRWHEIDTAKETYRNATVDVLSLLRVVQSQAESSLSRQDQVNYILQRAQAALADMGAMERDLSQASSVLSETVDRLSAEAAMVLRGMVAEILESHALAGRLADQEMSLNLELAIDKHSVALHALVTPFRTALEAEASSVFAAMAVQYQALQEQASSAMAQWQTLNLDIRSLQQAIERLLATSSEATTQLAIHASQATAAQRVQQDATHSAATLAFALAALANGTRDELSAINASAVAVKEELSLARRYRAGVWDAPWLRAGAEYSLTWLLQTVPGGNRPNLDVLLQLPAVRVGWFCLQAVWCLLRVGVSTVAGSLLLACSLRKWLPTTALLRALSLGDKVGEGSRDAQRPHCQCSEAATPAYSCPPPPTLALLPSRSAYLAARAAPYSGERSPHRRFSRTPDRLCARRTEGYAP